MTQVSNNLCPRVSIPLCLLLYCTFFCFIDCIPAFLIDVHVAGSFSALVQLIESTLAKPLEGGAAQQKQMFLASTLRNRASMDLFMETLTASGLHAQLLGQGNQLNIAVRFQCVSVLDNMRHLILLHRITADATKVDR